MQLWTWTKWRSCFCLLCLAVYPVRCRSLFSFLFFFRHPVWHLSASLVILGSCFGCFLEWPAAPVCNTTALQPHFVWKHHQDDSPRCKRKHNITLETRPLRPVPACVLQIIHFCHTKQPAVASVHKMRSPTVALQLEDVSATDMGNDKWLSDCCMELAGALWPNWMVPSVLLLRRRP